jgi:hypothetical protein
VAGGADANCQDRDGFSPKDAADSEPLMRGVPVSLSLSLSLSLSFSLFPSLSLSACVCVCVFMRVCMPAFVSAFVHVCARV